MPRETRSAQPGSTGIGDAPVQGVAGREQSSHRVQFGGSDAPLSIADKGVIEMGRFMNMHASALRMRPIRESRRLA
jgi:hypothetical protein